MRSGGCREIEGVQRLEPEALVGADRLDFVVGGSEEEAAGRHQRDCAVDRAGETEIGPPHTRQSAVRLDRASLETPGPVVRRRLVEHVGAAVNHHPP